MGDSSGEERPSWTSFLTLDHPLAIFCPHHAEHKRKKEEAAALLNSSRAPSLESDMATSGGETSTTSSTSVTQAAPGPATSGCPVMATAPGSGGDGDGGAGLRGRSESGCGGGEGVGAAAGQSSAAGQDSASTTSSCPVSPEARSVWTSLNPSNNMMVQERQMPSPNQDSPLPTVRAAFHCSRARLLVVQPRTSPPCLHRRRPLVREAGFLCTHSMCGRACMHTIHLSGTPHVEHPQDGRGDSRAPDGRKQVLGVSFAANVFQRDEAQGLRAGGRRHVNHRWHAQRCQ
jgi:hypothetical protein